MRTKLVTLEQVSLLKKGDIIERYPSYGEARDVFDEQATTLIDAFEIRSFNSTNEMLELVMAGASANIYPSPGDIGRLFIKSYNLLGEKTWWQEDSK